MTGIVLGPATLGIMALAGAAILVLAVWSTANRVVRVATAVLGIGVFAYPFLLGLAMAGRGGEALQLLATTGHLLPLATASLLPILATGAVTGKPRTGWIVALAALVLVSTAASAAGQFGAGESPLLLSIGSFTWLASFGLPMAATWPAVRGTSGDVRRRTIVCGLAAVVPVVIISFCLTLGEAQEVVGHGDAAVTALMLGFSASTLSTAALARGAASSRETWARRAPVVVGLLAATLAAATVIVALGVGLAITAAGGGAPVAVVAGVLVTASVGIPAARLHSWVALQVDPPPVVASELTARTEAAIAAERQRLSRDLHDGLQGRLLGITLNLQLSGAQLADPAARLLVDDTVSALRDAVDEVRSLSEGRVPGILAEGGLGPAVAHLVRPLSRVTSLSLPTRRFAADVEATAYFVVSEALANAVKHARADNIGVTVRDAGDTVLVAVVDDGVGGADPRAGSGLRGIAERVSASGGLLVVGDAAPHGTVVEARLPCGS